MVTRLKMLENTQILTGAAGDLRAQLASLVPCRQVDEVVLADSTKCRACYFSPAADPLGGANARLQLDRIEQELEELNEVWSRSLKSELTDPTAQKGLGLLGADRAAAVTAATEPDVDPGCRGDQGPEPGPRWPAAGVAERRADPRCARSWRARDSRRVEQADERIPRGEDGRQGFRQGAAGDRMTRDRSSRPALHALRPDGAHRPLRRTGRLSSRTVRRQPTRPAEPSTSSDCAPCCPSSGRSRASPSGSTRTSSHCPIRPTTRPAQTPSSASSSLEHGTPYDEATDDYHREPFAADVSEGKNDPIYNAHSYHTKVPHKAIMRYILHYTKPGDIVLDGFCGTGMTGVAAQLCGSPDSDFKAQVEAEWAEAGHDKPEWGTRYAILGDLSPAATFIAYNYNTPIDVRAFRFEANRILDNLDAELGWMYETTHSTGELGHINYTVWSQCSCLSGVRLRYRVLDVRGCRGRGPVSV